MEHTLRFVIVFLWCVCFGFFSVMSYLDDTMSAQKTTPILVGLLVCLIIYGAIEWGTKKKGPDLPAQRREEPIAPSPDARIPHGIRTPLTLANLSAAGRISAA